MNILFSSAAHSKLIIRQESAEAALNLRYVSYLREIWYWVF